MLKKRITKLLIFTVLIAAVVGMVGCEETYTPKPKGYFRIALPQKVYQGFNTPCPFSFEYPMYALVHPDLEQNSQPCWYNVDFPLFRAKLHLSYAPLQNNVHNHIEAVRTLAYKHTAMADAIDERLTYLPEHNKFGVFYEIKGNAASPLQFFVTDSVNHFMRGALYFNHSPNKDSLGPVIDYIKADMAHLIQTLEWK